MASIRIRGLRKNFGATIAVAGVDLDINDGEFMVLLGPSGSGKTTTLRCIAGLEHPDQGDIHIGDALVTHLSPADRDIAFVFQMYALYPHLSVYNNIAFPLRAQHVAKDDIDRAIKEVASVLHISHLLSRKPGQISGGEMQRVALGRAMVRRPRAFLMDEPLTTLDAKLREEMRAELKRLQADLRATTVYVTHDQVEAMSMADRIAVMNDGRLQQVGTPAQVYDTPQTLFVAHFVGSPGMNFVDCTLSPDSTTLLAHRAGFELPLSVPLSPEVARQAAGHPLVLGVRPEDVAVSTDTRQGWLPAEVYVVEPLGSENIVDLKVGEQIIRAKTAPTFKPQMGAPVHFSIDQARMHLFDRESEQALT